MRRLAILAIVAIALPTAWARGADDAAKAQADARPLNQPPAAAPAAAPAPAAVPTTQPEGVQIKAKVVQTTGSVIYRSASGGGEFKPVTVGMELGGDTLISTGRKATALLQFGDNSAVLLEQFSILTIEKVYQTRVADKTKVTTRLKLNNGSVRAGVERGKTESDFQVATPVATLSVRGTLPIRVYWDPGTGTLWFYLGSQGQIGVRIEPGAEGGPGKLVLLDPGEGTNQDLLMAILLAQFQQYVQLGDPWGQTLQEYLVEVFNQSALGSFGGGNPLDLIQQILNDQRTITNNSTDDDSGGDDAEGDVLIDDFSTVRP
ncbi:MAG: hypothetical protein BIFFINMI_03204 [Phycisphaerae bacterium]|nr:hypothetical protein [Phycisphaerae bacterium]